MTLVATKALRCDECTRIEDFGVLYPATAKELRIAARESGWILISREDVCQFCKRKRFDRLTTEGEEP